MFCPHCGAETSEGARFCKSCGNALAQVPEQPASSQPFPQGANAAAGVARASAGGVKIIAAIVAVLAVVAVLAAAFAVISGQQNDNDAQSAAGASRQSSSGEETISDEGVETETQASLEEAYYAKVQEYLEKYGQPSVMAEGQGGNIELRGACLVLLEDMDKDGADELLIGYFDPSISTGSTDRDFMRYRTHVYEYYDGAANQILDIPMNMGTNGGIAYLDFYGIGDTIGLLDEEHPDNGRDRDMTLLKKQGHEFKSAWSGSEKGMGPTSVHTVNGSEVTLETFNGEYASNVHTRLMRTYNFVQAGNYAHGDAQKVSASQVLDLTNRTIDQLASAVGQESPTSSNAEREKQEALDANPTVVKAQPSKSSELVTLTGVVDVQQGEENRGNGMEKVDVAMIRLPKPVTVSGTQYGEQTYDIVILQNDVDITDLVGKTVTFSLRLNVRATASIASAKYSPIIASDVTVIRTFE